MPSAAKLRRCCSDASQPARPEGARRLDENDNVEMRRWWPGMDDGSPSPDLRRPPARAALGDRARARDLGHGVGREARRLDVPALSRRGLATDSRAHVHSRWTATRTPTKRSAHRRWRSPRRMMSTGHLPKSVDDMYAIERDGLWADSDRRGAAHVAASRARSWTESSLPIRLTALPPCFRREAGAAGKRHEGTASRARVRQGRALRVLHAGTSRRRARGHPSSRRGMLQALGLTYRVLDLCAGDLGNGVGVHDRRRGLQPRCRTAGSRCRR